MKLLSKLKNLFSSADPPDIIGNCKYHDAKNISINEEKEFEEFLKEKSPKKS